MKKLNQSIINTILLLIVLSIYPYSLLSIEYNGKVRDGSVSYDDVELTFSTTTLYANWDNVKDVSSYWYAIGTAPGKSDIVNWKSNELNTSIKADKLNLIPNTIYYFSVYVQDLSGQKSNIVSSNGQTVKLFIYKGGLKPLTPDERNTLNTKIQKITHVEPNQIALNRYSLSPGKKFGLSSSAANYQYLPYVGDQKYQGSCSAWACCYYYKTYQESKDYGWGRNDPTTNSSKVMSPAFGYNLANYGYDGGSNLYTVMEILANHGCATWSDMPYTGMYDYTSYTTWPEENVWRNSLVYRSDNFAYFDLASDVDITNLKQHLDNGDLSVVGIDVYSNWWTVYPNNNTGIDNQVLFANSGTYEGGHALAIIGYDDTKSYNDGTGTKYGAFLIVNSWGKQWGAQSPDPGENSKGYMWVSYEYMKQTDDYGYNIEVYTMIDKSHYSPEVYGILGINCLERGDLKINFIGGDNSYYCDWSLNCLNYYGGGVPINQNIVVDLTNNALNYNKKFWLDVRNYSSYDAEITCMGIQKVGKEAQFSGNAPRTILSGEHLYIEQRYSENAEVSIAAGYPNPCYIKRDGYVKFPLSNDSSAKVYIYNIAGELVRMLSDGSGIESLGETRIGRWNGKDERGEMVASGVYFYVMKYNGRTKKGKVAIFW